MNDVFTKSGILAISGCLLLSNGIAQAAEEKITVRKMGDEFVVRSEFSSKYDLVILNFRYANEGAYLIPKDLELKNFRKGRKIHMNGDEYPATMTGSLGTLSGNHGSRYGRTLLIPNHGMTDADIYCIGRGLLKENQLVCSIIVNRA